MSDCVGSAESGTPDYQSGGGGATPTSALIGKAWQRRVRESQEADHENELHLFPSPDIGQDWRVKDGVVRRITRATARPFVLANDYLQTMPLHVYYCFGVYFGRTLGGVLVFGPDYLDAFGVWEKCGWGPYHRGPGGTVLLLSRGACAWWTPSGTASRFIMTAIRLLPKNYKVITATVDPRAGEIGTIYQACGWDYVGPMSLHAFEYELPDGTRVTDFAARRYRGDQRRGLRRVRVAAKGRYFYFRGSDTSQLRQGITHRLKPYPKRKAGAA